MEKEELKNYFSRRNFVRTAGLGVMAAGLQQIGCSGRKKSSAAIDGLENVTVKQDSLKPWVPVSDKKLRVGLVGYGVCKFSAAFGFQNHPNVEVVAVSDLFPDRCAELAKITKCKKTYPSLEELIKDKNIDAVMISTDAPSHAHHAIITLQHGKHVAINVPAVFGSLEDADRLLEEVKKSGLKYMMFETSSFHEDLYAMRQIYKAGGFGELVYSEGEYWHYSEKGIDSYKGWRHGMPPMWYLTHASAYHIGVTDGSFTEVSCLGMPSYMERYLPGNNKYNNRFASQIALFRTSEGGMARMCRSSDTPGFGGEIGRIRGQKGSYYGKYQGLEKDLPDLDRPSLPPGVAAGGHGGSHGMLMDEFVSSVLQDRKPLVDVAISLNMTVCGIVAHQSSMKDGETMKIPQFKF
ncbi:MAG TPA: gfo/Idh/MocA family oxidoreductase [Bacteroidales bacterium]|nr:gfo/Idh/MocA family oxidoreductase [Bacteroidales bacterium]